MTSPYGAILDDIVFFSRIKCLRTKREILLEFELHLTLICWFLCSIMFETICGGCYICYVILNQTNIKVIKKQDPPSALPNLFKLKKDNLCRGLKLKNKP